MNFKGRGTHSQPNLHISIDLRYILSIEMETYGASPLSMPESERETSRYGLVKMARLPHFLLRKHMAKKGGLTLPVLDCIFNGAESIVSFGREYAEGLYRVLPHLYAVCIADNSGGSRRIVGGFFVKTSFTHHDSEFKDSLFAVLAASEKLAPFLGQHSSLLPARLTVLGSAPLPEIEMLRILRKQFLKHSVGGNA